MKRIISMILCLALLVCSLALVSCGEEEVKLGLGVVVDASASSATADKAGAGEFIVTVATVLVNEEGKIVKCLIDTADVAVSFSAEGKASAAGDLKTKYELGAGYGMANNPYSSDIDNDGTIKEWFEQIDAFCAAAEGKTIDEVKALVANTGYGVEGGELINADCTINVADYVKALEKAVANATVTGANSASVLGLGIVTEQDNTDATADKAGAISLETTIFATATDADGKVVAAESDVAAVDFGFDNAGVTSFTKGEIKTKRELGAGYGMAGNPYAADLNGDGVVKEWFEQADALEALCIGKNADEIKALAASDGYGTADVKNAACTIVVSGLVSAAVKAAD